MSNTVVIPGATYAYAYGRIGTLQGVLLTEADRNRLLGATDGKDAVSILTELALSKFIDQGLSTAPAMLSAIEHWLEQEVYSMTPDETRPALAILWIDSIASTLSLALKQKLQLSLEENPLKELLGTTDEYEAWMQYIERDETTGLPAIAKQLLSMMPSIGTTAMEVDQNVFNAAAKFKLAAAKRAGSKAIVTYVKHTIDCTNILNSLRFSAEKFAEYFLPGGQIDRMRFNSKESLATGIDSVGLSYDLSNALRSDNIEEVEMLCTNVRKKDLAHMWNTPLTIEPIFAFAATALNHTAYVRNVIIGKFNDIDPQELKLLLPTFIPGSAFA